MVTARRELRRRIDALRSLPLVASCTNAQLARLDRLGTQVEVAAGRILTDEGEEGRECFVVLDGIAAARRAKEQLGVIGAGSIAGEMALLYDVPRLATVVACTPMRLWVLSAYEFEALLDAAPCIRHNVHRIGAERRVANHQRSAPNARKP